MVHSKTNVRGNSLHAIWICSFVILLADFGLVSEYDAVLGALFISLIFPQSSPLLLLVIASIQDAPGLAGVAWYAGIVLVGMVTLFHPKNIDTSRPYIVSKWGVAGTFVVVFAIIVSVVNQSFGGLAQAPQRNPVVAGGLMIFMIWVGLKTAALIQQNPSLVRKISSVVVLLVAHSIGVALLQVIIGPTFLVSSQGLADVENTALSIETAIGVARIHGTYLTPNGFALCILLMVLLDRASRKEANYGFGFAMFWVSLGVLLSALSLSKAIGIFTILIFGFMCSRLMGWRLMLALFASAAILIAGFISSGFVEDLLSAFRVTNELGGESLRAQAWQSVMTTFTWSDWLLGTGISHWPILFEEQIGVPLADPHTWPLSLPGTFGVLGVVFFFSIIFALSFVALRRKGNEQMVAVAMLVLFLVKDLFSIPYLLGNTPLSFLIWLILGLLLSSDSRKLVISR